ncbi:coiled-coil domain-containing protein [Terriglobus tenax]|uniref:coiled-coil domain-containing protein n=1 Tax=Terriglobus tenax TaxID=1111115 RepID=UPI0021E0F174|nr:hypothetical protein [Terriglobus tenax]
MRIWRIWLMGVALLLSGGGAMDVEAQEAKAESDEVKALREEMAAMRKELQAQIDLLKTQLIAKSAPAVVAAPTTAVGRDVEEFQEAVGPLPVKPSVKAATAPVPLPGVSASGAPAATVAASTKSAAGTTQPPVTTDGPGSFRFKGVQITPGGFFSLDSIYRSRAMANEVNTIFSQLPYSGAGLAHVSEWFASGRQSRFQFLAEGNTKFGKLTGYFETDFIGAGITSNNNQSNSYVLRQRQLWGQASFNSGWSFAGGQMWTLATEHRRGVEPRFESLPTVIDASQHIGYTWGRQGSVRVTKKLGSAVQAAFSLEQSQALFSATNAPNNFFLGSPGVPLGALNPTFNYTNNPAPDVLTKVAYDPVKGGVWRGHYELGGMVRFFRSRYYPTGSATPQSDTKAGGSFFASARVPVTQRLEIGAKVLAGRGVGRYGAATLPDVTVHPDGTLAPLTGAQGFLRAEFKATKNLDLFTYHGWEYMGRLYYRAGDGTLVGYAPPSMVNTGCETEAAPTSNNGFSPGTPSNCVGATRLLSAHSFGYTYRFYEGPAGRFQISAQYSHLRRNGWTGVGGTPQGINHFVYTSVRYYLP